MGAEQSRSVTDTVLPVVTLPNDIPEEGPAAAVPPPAAAAPPPSAAPEDATNGGGSLEQLPSVPPKAENAANSAIVRDLGDYKLEKQVLGEGAFGKVRLATSTRTAHRVAVKVIKRKKLNERAEVLLQRERKHHEKVRRIPRAPRCRPRGHPAFRSLSAARSIPSRALPRASRSFAIPTSCACTPSS